MNLKLKIETLEQMTPFQDMSYSNISLLAELIKFNHFEAGDVIIKDGEVFPNLGFIVEGKVGFYREEAGGETLLVMESYPKYMTGVFGLLYRRSPGLKAKVLERLTLATLEFEEVAMLEKENPVIALAIYKYIAKISGESLLRWIKRDFEEK